MLSIRGSVDVEVYYNKKMIRRFKEEKKDTRIDDGDDDDVL